MHLYSKLSRISKKVQDNERLAMINTARRLFNDLETDLLVIAGKGGTKAEFIYIGWPKEILQELQKLLKKQGLIVELSNDNMLSISW